MNSFLTSELRLVKSALQLELVVQHQPLFFQYFNNHVELFAEPTFFLDEKFVSVGATPSKHTWEAVGYDLLSWFQWCQLRKIEWHEATEDDRRQFSDDYFQDGTDERTINRKLTVVRRFYDFARGESWYRRDIGLSAEKQQIRSLPIDQDELAHIHANDRFTKERDSLLRKVGKKDVMRPMQVKHLRKLLEQIGPTNQNAQDRRQVRDRLICDLGYISGTRLGDVTNLTTLQFLNIIVEPHEQLMDFPIIVEGKRRVTRKVAAPGWLILAIQAYIYGERTVSEREGKQRGVKTCTSLFLGHAGSKSAGKPISRSAIQKMFAAACMKTGITKQIEVLDYLSDRKHIKTVPAHSYHDLRHNCAVLTYHVEIAKGNTEPWKHVQIKLGHKSVRLTMDTYLAHVSIFGDRQSVTDIRRLLGL